MTDLDKRVIRSLLWFFPLLAALIFIPAGTLDYWQAWVFLAVYIVSSLAIIFYLRKRDPQLLERRMHGGPGAEKEKTQKVIMSLISVAFIALIVVPAFDYRVEGPAVPPHVALLGDALTALAYLAFYLVFKENSFASATIEFDSAQRVISTGPYALVRHPMYAGGLPMLVGIPLALGSWRGLLVLIPLLPVLIWRLLDEEQLLA
ncbi:MAG: isoprenylcysteine carboxylmethyltransferase family protein, partial [Rhodomicrobium sp.]